MREVRQKTEVPLVLMGYYNPIFKFGEAKFVDISSDAGVDGLIVVDLPPEEAGQLKAEAERNKLNLIFLLTPVSSEERIKLVCEWSSGFIYCVSYTGVTGGGEKEEEALANLVRKIRTLTATPVEIGFGISSPQDAKKASRVADGIIVGSAIIKEITSHTSSDNLVGRVGQMVEKLVRAARR
ncbi:Tryptophan synthase alpha chain [subsurface metagenome]